MRVELVSITPIILRSHVHITVGFNKCDIIHRAVFFFSKAFADLEKYSFLQRITYIQACQFSFAIPGTSFVHTGYGQI